MTCRAVFSFCIRHRVRGPFFASRYHVAMRPTVVGRQCRHISPSVGDDMGMIGHLLTTKEEEEDLEGLRSFFFFFSLKCQ